MSNQKRQNQGKARPIVAFWNEHKKEIKIATGILASIGVTVLAGLGIKYYWNATAFERWFKKASLEELNEARNNIHNEYMRYTVNDEYRKFLWDILPKFDNRICEIEKASKKVSGPAYRREHGYNLYKPD